MTLLSPHFTGEKAEAQEGVTCPWSELASGEALSRLWGSQPGFPFSPLHPATPEEDADSATKASLSLRLSHWARAPYVPSVCPTP